MVAQPAELRSSCNSGEIGENLYDRIDLKQWYQAMKRMRNVEPVPQGGFQLMPGSRYIGRARKGIATIDAESSFDDTEQETAAPVYTLAFDGVHLVAVVEIIGFLANADFGTKATVQYEEPVSGDWLTFAGPFDVTLEERTRLAARPPGNPVAATGVRLLAHDMTDGVEITVAGMSASAETSSRVTSRVIPFTFSATEVYDLVFTPPVIDVWRNGVHVGAALTLVTPSQLAAVKVEQSFDTLFLFHRKLESERLLRRGGDREWQYDKVPWEDIAEVDMGGDYAKTNDKWDIFIRWSDDDRPDLYLNTIVDDEETGAVILAEGGSPDYTAWKAAIKAAIEGLPSMRGTVDVTHSTGTKLIMLTLEFTGDNAGIDFGVSVQIVNTATASALASHIQIGETAGEAIMSATRGWPSCGVLYQDRFNLGGFDQKASALAHSRVAEYFDFNIKAAGAAAAIVNNLGTKTAQAISHLFAGRHLLIFTDVAGYFITNRAIAKTESVNYDQTFPYGIQPDADVVEIDEAVYFASAEGGLIYAAAYDDVAAKYLADPASLLASHLIDGIRGLALQAASSETDAARLFARRSDGRLIVGLIIRNQDVLGFCEWATDGAVESIMVDGANRPMLTVTRAVGADEETFVETLEKDLLFHAAITQTFGDPTVNVANLEPHEGAVVWADADGYIVGPFTVAGGAIALPFAASNITVGRWTPPYGETLPDVKVLQQGIVLLRPGRIHTVRAKILDTTSIAVGANGGRPRDVSLYRGGMPTDAPLAGQSKRISVEGISGWRDDGPTAVFTQVKPGRMTVAGWALEKS